MAKEPEEELDPREIRADLIKCLKESKKRFFGLVPKGTLGQLVLDLDKAIRDQDAEAVKKDTGGGTIVKGICVGALNDKLFTLDKQLSDKDKKKLKERLQLVIRRTTGLSIDPEVKNKGERDQKRRGEEEEDK